MTARPQRDEHADATEAASVISPRLKRRGLIAGAAVLAAAVLAKQTATPVIAGYSLQTDTTNATSGTTVINGTTTGGATPSFRVANNSANTDANADAIQGYAAGAGNVGVFGRNNDLNGIGIRGNAPNGQAVVGETGDGVAVSATALATGGTAIYASSISGVAVNAVSGASGTAIIANATSGYGVLGASTNIHGVFGQTNAGWANAGVYGLAANTGSAIGVFGTSPNGAGLAGTSTAGMGLYASSVSGVGIAAYSTTSHGITASTRDLYGVVGGSTNSIGVYGASSASHGVYGAAGTGAGAAAVYGYASSVNAVAVAGNAVSPATNAGIFYGNVTIYGNFGVSGSKSAIVKHPDGSQRLLYCVEGPESWFTDFGESKLVSGKVDVKLDADFTAVVDTSSYRVMLTAKGDANALYLAAQTTSGFTVQEAKGGTSNVAFTYCVVAKRKDIVGARFATVTTPTVADPPARVKLPILSGIPASPTDAMPTLDPVKPSTAPPPVSAPVTTAPNAPKTPTATPTPTTGSGTATGTATKPATGTAATPNPAPPSRP